MSIFKNLFHYSKFVLLAVLIFFFVYGNPVSAQTSAVGERRAQLERELANLEKQIDAQRGILSRKEKESVLKRISELSQKSPIYEPNTEMPEMRIILVRTS